MKRVHHITTLVAVGFSEVSAIHNEIPRTLVPGINTRIAKRLNGIEIQHFPGGLVCCSYFESNPTGRPAITLLALGQSGSLLTRLEVVAPDQGMASQSGLWCSPIYGPH